MAMEAVTGGDLRKLVYEALMDKRYTDGDALRWGLDISKAMHYLHTRQPMIIHRDLKLENVLLDGACPREWTPTPPAPRGAAAERRAAAWLQRIGTRRSQTLGW